MAWVRNIVLLFVVILKMIYSSDQACENINPQNAGIDFRTESDVCRRQILTTKVDPRTVRVKIFLLIADT